MNNQPITVAFTGRRPKYLGGYEKEHYQEFLLELENFLRRLSQEYHATKYITGGAQGFDQLCFFCIDDIRREKSVFIEENKVYLPFEGLDEKWSPTGLFSKENYAEMLTLADETKIISSEHKVSSLFLRNHAMVDDCDLLVALYDSPDWSLPNTPSGTAECMRYAKEQHKPIIRLGYFLDEKGNLHLKAPVMEKGVSLPCVFQRTPLKDGITHINIYTKAETELGRFASNFTKCPIHTRDGEFASIEGYWGYLSIPENHPEKESFRTLYGVEAKKRKQAILKTVARREDPDFEDKIREAVFSKFSTPKAKEVLSKSKDYIHLPFVHYYYYGEKGNSLKIIDETENFRFWVDAVEDAIHTGFEEILSKEATELDDL